MAVKRPPELRKLKLTRREYQLIGEIIVLAGLLEQELRELPALLLQVPATKAIALTAHLNFQSLADINLAMLPTSIEHERLREEFQKSIKACSTCYEDRNRLAHGPFFPHPSGIKGTFRFTARGKVKPQGYIFDDPTLTEMLSELSAAYESLQVCVVGLLGVRGELPVELLRTLDRKPARKANPRKQPSQP